MIEMYKILTGKYDADVTPKVTRMYGSITRGNVFKLDEGRTKYDFRKYYFTNWVANAWNSLPDHVVLSETINTFKSRLINFGNIKIWFMIFKQNFTEPEVTVYIAVTNYSQWWIHSAPPPRVV